MEVLYEDNHLLVVNKKAGWIVQGAGPEQSSLLEWSKSYIKQKFRKPGDVYLGVVSRLDAMVTGCVPFARTSKAAARLSEQLRCHSMVKLYWAIVPSKPQQLSGTLEHWLQRSPKDVVTRAFTKPSRDSQHGLLEYQWLRTTSLGELLEIRLITGRKHQIRAQFQAIGLPILGDVRYGSKQMFADGIALHCRRLLFKHPTREEQLDIVANVPGYWP